MDLLALEPYLRYTVVAGGEKALHLPLDQSLMQNIFQQEADSSSTGYAQAKRGLGSEAW